jgi:hypothetical protein
LCAAQFPDEWTWISDFKTHIIREDSSMNISKPLEIFNDGHNNTT